MDTQMKDALRAALKAAILEVGMDAFKSTSMFPLSNRKHELELKAAA